MDPPLQFCLCDPCRRAASLSGDGPHHQGLHLPRSRPGPCSLLRPWRDQLRAAPGVPRPLEQVVSAYTCRSLHVSQASSHCDEHDCLVPVGATAERNVCPVLLRKLRQHHILCLRLLPSSPCLLAVCETKAWHKSCYSISPRLCIPQPLKPSELCLLAPAGERLCTSTT